MVEDIHRIMLKLNVHVLHICREANQLSNYVANMTINTTDIQQFWSFNQLPSRTRRLVNSDKQQIPYLRIKPGREQHADKI